MKPDYALARADIVDGIFAFDIWLRLGWQEIKRRYRRTVFGPLWATLSLAIFVSALSYVWAPLFQVEIRTYLPFLTTGMVSWSFVSALINDGCTTFISGEGLIKTMNFPYSTFAFMIAWRNTIVLLHHLAIVVFVYVAFPENLSFNLVLFAPAVLIVAVNGAWIGMLLGMVSTRFRDIPPLIGNLMGVMLFITPIFWAPSQLGDKGQYFASLNYLFHLVDILRSPLLGQRPSALSYGVTIGGAILGWTLTFMIYARFRRRLAFWL